MSDIYFSTYDPSEFIRVDETLAQQAKTSVTTTAQAIAQDRETGDLYIVDGQSSLEKYDSTLTKQWENTSFLSEDTQYIGFFDGALYLTSGEPGYLAKFDTSGTKQWTTSSNGYYGFTYDGSYFYATLGDGTYDKIDPSDGTKVTGIQADSNSAYKDFRYAPSGHIYAVTDTGVAGKISDIGDGTEAWTVSYSNSFHPYLYLDNDENLYFAKNHIHKLDSSGNKIWDVNFDSSYNGYYDGVQPHPDGSVYTFSGDTNKYYKLFSSDGSLETSKSPDSGGAPYGFSSFQRLDANPGAWSTTVTKSASATQVASSSAQRTASGAITDSASATTLASSATPQTPSGTSTADVTATEATSSTTQQTPGATGLASITATETASTVTMSTVSADRGRLANATTTGASTTMESPTGVTGWTAVASDVVASGGLTTPGVIESVDTTPGVYSLLSDFDNGGIRDVALSDGTTSSVTATKTVYSDGHTQDETGALYVTGSGSLVKYADDGTQQWETAESNTYYSAPVVTDRGYIYYIERPGSADDRLVKADRDTGDVVWDVPAGNPDSSSYTLEVDAGNALYYHDSGNAIRSYDVSDGSTQWFSESGHQTFTVGPDGTIYASDEVSGDKNFVEIDPSDGTESSPIFTLSGTIYDIQADDSGKLYLVRYNNSNYSLETYSSGGSQQWSHTMSGSPQTQFALNVDGSVTYKTDVSGTKHHVRVDSSGTETWDVSRPYNFGLIRPPKYGANGAAWTPTTTAHPSPMNVSASSSSSTPTTDGIVVSSATPTPGSTTMSGPVGTGGASAGVASVASSSGLFTPDPNGQTGASSVQISASSEPNTPASTGVASSTANPYPSSTSMRVAVRSAAVSATGSIIEATSALQTATGSPGRRASATTVDASASVETPSIGRLRVDVGTDASASTTMELPTVDIGVTASDSTYEAVADPRVPLIGLYATAQKYGAQGETNQAISFAPRTTALEGDGPAIEFTGRGSGPNGVDIDSSKE